MRASTLILAGLLTSTLLTSGCAMNRAESLNMLDRRAEYDSDNPSTPMTPGLKEAGLEGFNSSPVPVRTRPKVAAIWIHPHEMASHDYFWGGWMSVVVEQDQWLLSQPGGMPAAPGIMDVTGVKPVLTPPRVPGAIPKLKPQRKPIAR